MANNKTSNNMDKDLKFITNYAWKKFAETGDINCYGMIVGAREAQKSRVANRSNQPQM